MTKNPDPVDKYVGGRVRMRRQMLNMSQEKLAAGLGVSFQQVQKYEKGVNRMGSSRLQQVANVLKSPMPFFFDGAPGQTKGNGKAPATTYVSEFLATSDGLTLIRAFMRIKSAQLRRAVVNAVQE